MAAVLLVGVFYAYRFAQTVPSLGFDLDNDWRVTLPWQPPALAQQPVPHNGAISG